MRGPTRLDADSRRRQLGKEFRHLAAPDLAPQHRRLVLINPMNLKDMLGRVQPNSDNGHSDGSPLLRCHNITAWHIRCRRGPSTPTGTLASEEGFMSRWSWLPGPALVGRPGMTILPLKRLRFSPHFSWQVGLAYRLRPRAIASSEGQRHADDEPRPPLSL